MDTPNTHRITLFHDTNAFLIIPIPSDDALGRSCRHELRVNCSNLSTRITDAHKYTHTRNGITTTLPPPQNTIQTSVSAATAARLWYCSYRLLCWCRHQRRRCRVSVFSDAAPNLAPKNLRVRRECAYALRSEISQLQIVCDRYANTANLVVCCTCKRLYYYICYSWRRDARLFGECLPVKLVCYPTRTDGS